MDKVLQIYFQWSNPLWKLYTTRDYRLSHTRHLSGQFAATLDTYFINLLTAVNELKINCSFPTAWARTEWWRQPPDAGIDHVAGAYVMTWQTTGLSRRARISSGSAPNGRGEKLHFDDLQWTRLDGFCPDCEGSLQEQSPPLGEQSVVNIARPDFRNN